MSLSAEEYFAAPGVSNSMLGQLAQSPAHLQAYLRKPRETTLAMEIGTFFHELLLMMREPENIAVRDKDIDFRTAAGKKWKAEHEAKGMKILTKEEYDSIFGMRDSIMRNSRLRSALENGEPEHSLFDSWALKF